VSRSATTTRKSPSPARWRSRRVGNALRGEGRLGYREHGGCPGISLGRSHGRSPVDRHRRWFRGLHRTRGLRACDVADPAMSLLATAMVISGLAFVPWDGPTDAACDGRCDPYVALEAAPISDEWREMIAGMMADEEPRD